MFEKIDLCQKKKLIYEKNVNYTNIFQVLER